MISEGFFDNCHRFLFTQPHFRDRNRYEFVSRLRLGQKVHVGEILRQRYGSLLV